MINPRALLPLLAFGGFAAASAPAQADPRPATVFIGGRVVPFQVKPFVGPDGQVLAPVDAVQLLGARYTASADGTVTVTAANGRRYAFPYTSVGGRYCVPFARVASALGGTVDWQPATATLTVRARLQMVRQDFRELTVYTSYPVYYTVRRIGSPERLYVDLYGLDLATTPASIPTTNPAVSRIRSGQIDPQTVRITIDLKQDMAFRVLSGLQSSQVKVALGDFGAPPAGGYAPVPEAPVPPVPVAVTPPAARPPMGLPGVVITSVGYTVVSAGLTQIAVTTSRPTRYSTERLDSPSRLAFDLAGAVADRSVRANQPVTDSVVRDIRVGRFLTPQTNFGRVVLDLSRMVAFSVDQRPSGGGMTYLINVITGGSAAPPPPADGGGDVFPMPVPPVEYGGGGTRTGGASLAGKVIVVDPGHGGRDTGARDEFRTGRVYEKDITLSIGRRLRDILAQSGATVLMTRTDDTLPSVMARPIFANDHHADLFVSIHCDSSGGQNSHSGTTVYYHMQNPTCRQMAADISRRVGQVSGIPRLGTRSDTVRFGTGFGVLRGSYMPAVLVETGYMNCDSDLAKLRDDADQQRIAAGIAAGLRDFVADQAATARSARSGY